MGSDIKYKKLVLFKKKINFVLVASENRAKFEISFESLAATTYVRCIDITTKIPIKIPSINNNVIRLSSVFMRRNENTPGMAIQRYAFGCLAHTRLEKLYVGRLQARRGKGWPGMARVHKIFYRPLHFIVKTPITQVIEETIF